MELLEISAVEGSIHDLTGGSIEHEMSNENSKSLEKPRAKLATSTPMKPIRPKTKPTNSCTFPGCFYKTHKKYNFERHMSVHGMAQSVSCQTCKKTFKTEANKEDHEQGAHKGGYVCEICGKIYMSRGGLRHHSAVKHSIGPVKCHQCDKEFPHKQALTTHLNGHLNLKPYRCSTCKRHYQGVTSLRAHEKVCIGEGLVCEHCGCRFSHVSSLHDHVAAKHTSAFHACNCGKRFSWRTAYVRHRKRCNNEL